MNGMIGKVILRWLDAFISNQKIKPRFYFWTFSVILNREAMASASFGTTISIETPSNFIC